MTTKDRLVEIIMNGCKPLISPTQAGRAADALLANSVIVPPCNIGDYVYDIGDGDVYETRVVSFTYFSDDRWACRTVSRFFYMSDFGKEVFFTEEEARQALEAKHHGSL